MSRALLSTSRPSALRVVGFVCLAAGAAVAGIGATSSWATIGFPADVERLADVSVHGTDVWEGKVVLLTAVAALVAIVAMRVARSSGIRSALGVLLVASGIGVIALPLVDAVRAEDRFGGAEGVDLLAERLAAELELPADVVLEQLRSQFEAALRVDVGRGVWLSALGGALLAAGGVLGLVWSRRRDGPDGPGADDADGRADVGAG